MCFLSACRPAGGRAMRRAEQQLHNDLMNLVGHLRASSAGISALRALSRPSAARCSRRADNNPRNGGQMPVGTGAASLKWRRSHLCVQQRQCSEVGPIINARVSSGISHIQIAIVSAAVRYGYALCSGVSHRCRVPSLFGCRLAAVPSGSSSWN